ncbi:hypothetical protein [Leucothrix pacifica]|uniref:Uncharacterized protein n=1 Tax=Leucothrix pacifica TaxID=1247513 RepID=A0A317CJU9_9GAMM|nr:hypothetical protein [Leucothrix pacifica]PWQ98865.1 hypothetical protein DKW60_07415 [Leucothrix pacifica]
MATSDFVPKSELFDRLRTIFKNKESGMLTLLTESKQSILMRFSDGELTSARCRSWELENTIAALLETEVLKFSYISSSGEDKPPLVVPNDFMMMIDPGGPGLEDVVDEPEGVEEELVEPSAESQEQTETSAEDTDEEGKHVDRAIAAKMNFI